MNLLDRVLAKIDMDGPSGCWLWTDAPNSEGYGRLRIDGRLVYAHRLVYELVVDEIADGMTIDHGEVCSVRLCVNPDHLDVVTRAENTRRGALARTDQCPRGHLFDDANTRTTPRGSRKCRACHRDGERRRRAIAAEVSLGVPLIAGAS